jgi:hypothetical protein
MSQQQTEQKPEQKTFYQTLSEQPFDVIEYLKLQIESQFHTGTNYLVIPVSMYSSFISNDESQKIESDYRASWFSNKSEYINKRTHSLVSSKIRNILIEDFGFPKEIIVGRLSIYELNIFVVKHGYFK